MARMNSRNVCDASLFARQLYVASSESVVLTYSTFGALAAACRVHKMQQNSQKEILQGDQLTFAQSLTI